MIAQFLSFLNKKMAYRQTYTTDKTVAYNRQRYEISGQRMSLWNPKLWTPNKKNYVFKLYTQLVGNQTDYRKI